MTLLPEVEAAVLDAVRRDQLSRGKPVFRIRLRSLSRGLSALLVAASTAVALGVAVVVLATLHHGRPAASPRPAPPSTNQRSRVIARGPSSRSLEQALLAVTAPPRPTYALCHSAGAAEIRASPVGPPPLFLCTITLNGQRARYDVQVLRNGCYVAERRPPGQAQSIVGCAKKLVAQDWSPQPPAR
jgi:hypothetical protein